MFISTNIIYVDGFNCLAWWNDHKVMFPNLYKDSFKIFCKPATSAASERAFSDARNLITDKRSAISVNSENINKIMFLHNNIEN